MSSTTTTGTGGEVGQTLKRVSCGQNAGCGLRAVGEGEGGGRRGTHACMVINKCRFKYHGNNCEIWQNNRKTRKHKTKCMKCNYK